MDGKELIPESTSDYSKFIINRTGKPLVFERVNYGTAPFPVLSFGSVDLFQANEVQGVSVFPDYFPSERPPGSVTVTKGIEFDREEWLRFATQEEISRAETQKTLKHLREAGAPMLDAIMGDY